MAISSPGIGSSLDINSLVSQLMAIERRPLDLIQKRQAAVQTQISAWGLVKSQLAAFGDAAAALGKPANISAWKSALADPDVATVTTSSSAVAGSYALTVKQLAMVDKLATGVYASGSTVVGTGPLTISLGTWDNTGNTWTLRPDKTPVTITIDSSNNTLAGVRDAINHAAAGVTASIVTDNTGARLVISGSETGAKNALKIDSVGIAGLNWDPAVVGAQAMSHVQTAQDAKITLDTFEVVSSSNTITGAVDGVTLSLLAAKPSSPTVLSVTQDTTTVTQSLRTFVKGWNDLNSVVRGYTSYDATTKKAGTLQGQSTVLSMATALHATVSGSIPGSGAELTRLSEIGISIQTDGSLKLDETKLASALSTGFDAVTRLFSQSGSGADTFVSRIKAVVDKAQGTDGTLVTKIESLNKSVTQYSKDQAAMNVRLNATQARYLKQFTALDKAISSQTAIASYLTNQTAIWNKSTT